mmetsp:Transcript_133034/g.413655  ORF Transcript_133034/g.413655 Transcript_133034/m.413655 type:complete len:200 (-) Transcript_133034:8-607(-)
MARAATAGGKALYQNGAALVPILRAMPLQLDAPVLELVHELVHALPHSGAELGGERGRVRRTLRSPDCPPRERVPSGGLPRGRRGRRGAVREQVVRGPVLLRESVKLRIARVCCRQEAREQLGMLRGLGEEAEPDEPGQDHEELCIKVLEHGGERGDQSLRLADLRDQVAKGGEQPRVLDVSRADLPALLPVHEALHES